MAVRPEGRLLVTADRAVRLPSGIGPRPRPRPGRRDRRPRLRPDSTTLYAAGTHAPLQRCTIDPTQAVTRICARTGGADLTPAQWHRYVSGAPYRKVRGH
ncbi:hypothetical protein STRIP9103_05591 [Streptomyces ipomoeae 91-03]|uniref:Uncharacterized protein n=1 Tax=Streptomyces ipomoeae 91-03 TaxID=698759 RepID=L1KLC6_9ACTN|nr:hypothetical protein STRIP9103_05591 [Streptomyces ipomoeae 91-03]